jgi:hypothetical protein
MRSLPLPIPHASHFHQVSSTAMEAIGLHRLTRLARKIHQFKPTTASKLPARGPFVCHG